MTGIIGLQRRMMELGRVRLGEKGPKGEPRKIDAFRLTSASRTLLEAASQEFGGAVREWKGAPDEGYFELYTERSELPIVIPPVYAASDGQPTYPFSQFYEEWKGGGCQRRCDGVTEALSGKLCLCDPSARTCEIVTRFSFIIPDVPGIGLWRMESGGINAAIELPATLEFLSSQAATGIYIHAELGLEQRSSKKEGLTRRFVVPVVRVPGIRPRDMLGNGAQVAINGPTAAPARPPLPEGPPAPAADEAAFAGNGDPGFGAAPDLPVLEAAPVTVEEPKPLTKAQQAKLGVLVGKFRDKEQRIKTDHLWASVATMRDFPVDQMIELLEGRDAEGVLHFGPLLASLTRTEASALIDRLESMAGRTAAA